MTLLGDELYLETYAKIRPLLGGTGPELSPEMMVAALKARQRIIEVPVSHHRRIGGESRYSANYFRISRTALFLNASGRVCPAPTPRGTSATGDQMRPAAH